MKLTQIAVNAFQCKTAHIGRRFIGSCRTSSASNAAPWNYAKSEAI